MKIGKLITHQCNQLFLYNKKYASYTFKFKFYLHILLFFYVDRFKLYSASHIHEKILVIFTHTKIQKHTQKRVKIFVI